MNVFDYFNDPVLVFQKTKMRVFRNILVTVVSVIAVLLVFASLFAFNVKKVQATKLLFFTAVVLGVVCVGISSNINEKAYNLVQDNSLVMVTTKDKEISREEFYSKYNGEELNFEAEEHVYVKSVPVINPEMRLKEERIFTRALNRNKNFKNRYYAEATSDTTVSRLDKDSNIVKAKQMIGNLTGIYL